MDAADPVRGRGSAAAAWFVAHDGPVVLIVTVVLTALLTVGADGLLPVPGTERALPVWQLMPALFALVTSQAAINGLPAQHATSQVYAARAAWCVTVAATAGACVHVVDLVSGLPALAPATMIMVVGAFGLSSVIGRGAVVLGAAAMVHIVVNVRRYGDTGNPWRFDQGLVAVVVGSLIALGFVGYVRWGSNRLRPRHPAVTRYPYRCPHG
ncbi:hypothetical protein EFK50_07325 [Nocardioides marmoriginsengisoli]|uniref:Uncharacterized protein n=1 Tax=Nocardioides marmoriginsengisoli TaxID=661483 RepID=A0A3N0CLP1_9ACTN|nr:hypothetical protein [Nocardioides marmoriginsengisoli]RNL64330.1 hypothetical protein EFK50_07325 [Nocardioides marmoriginsengisoli]